MTGTTRNWAKSVVNWNIALDSSGGPHLGGCDTCTGLVTLQPDGSVTKDAEYFTIGHLSKFVKPGAVRIGSTSYGTTGWNGQLMSVAFRNPDGSTALLVHNENDAPRTFAVALGDKSFEYELPGGSIATFTWGRTPANTLHEVTPRSAATNVNESDAGLLIDADGSTVWQSKTAQTPGQWVSVDLGRSQPIRQIALDSGGNTGDFAHGHAVALSNDGRAWRTVAQGSSSSQLTTIELRPTRARYVRVTQTGSAENWWSLADLRIYR
jgi:glucosylceramidase